MRFEGKMSSVEGACEEIRGDERPLFVIDSKRILYMYGPKGNS